MKGNDFLIYEFRLEFYYTVFFFKSVEPTEVFHVLQCLLCRFVGTGTSSGIGMAQLCVEAWQVSTHSTQWLSVWLRELFLRDYKEFCGLRLQFEVQVVEMLDAIALHHFFGQLYKIFMYIDVNMYVNILYICFYLHTYVYMYCFIIIVFLGCTHGINA